MKISDFGLSALYIQDADTDHQSLLTTTCGTPNYVAPEVLADEGYDGAMADTWSIGVILYVFMAGFLPFDEATMTALFRKIQTADFSYPSWFDDEIKDLLGKILVVNPAERISIREIMLHSWWKKGGPYADYSDLDRRSIGLYHGLPRSPLAEEEKKTSTAPKSFLQKTIQGEYFPKGSEGENGTASADTGSLLKVKSTDNNTEESKVLPAEELRRSGTEIRYPKKANAFEVISLFSGAAIGRLLLTKKEDPAQKLFMYTTPMTSIGIMAIIMTELSSIPGFLEHCKYKENSKICTSFDFCPGRVNVKTTIKICSVEPNLCLVIFKHVNGNSNCFYKNIGCRLDDLAAKIGALAS